MKILRGLFTLCALVLALSGCSRAAVPPAEVQEEKAHEHAEGVIHLHDDDFAQIIQEIAYHLDEYAGETIQMEGFAVVPEDGEFGDLPISFGVLRGAILNGEEQYIGLDCYHEGKSPADEQWVSISGVIASYADGAGDVYPLVMVQSWESAPEQAILHLTEADFEHSH